MTEIHCKMVSLKVGKQRVPEGKGDLARFARSRKPSGSSRKTSAHCEPARFPGVVPQGHSLRSQSPGFSGQYERGTPCSGHRPRWPQYAEMFLHSADAKNAQVKTEGIFCVRTRDVFILMTIPFRCAARHKRA